MMVKMFRLKNVGCVNCMCSGEAHVILFSIIYITESMSLHSELIPSLFRDFKTWRCYSGYHSKQEIIPLFKKMMYRYNFSFVRK